MTSRFQALFSGEQFGPWSRLIRIYGQSNIHMELVASLVPLRLDNRLACKTKMPQEMPKCGEDQQTTCMYHVSMPGPPGEVRPLKTVPNKHNVTYLQTKRDRLNHKTILSELPI
jgi:hypothetical protein